MRCFASRCRSVPSDCESAPPVQTRVKTARRLRVACYLQDNEKHVRRERTNTKVAIVGSGPAAHTAAIYLARAELEPILLEGWMANGLPPGGQLTTTTYVENFPGFPEPILGCELTERFRQQSINYGTCVYTETVSKLDLGHGAPFTLWTDSKEISAYAVVIATGAAARKLPIGGLDQYWQNGISACAVCDGSSPLFRNKPVAVVGGGDVAMEEALFLTKYASKVYIIHRFDYLEASRLMARRALAHPKIEVLWEREVVEAYGNDDGTLAGVRIYPTGQPESALEDLPASGLFFAVGHVPGTAFLAGQVALDDWGYIITAHDSTATSVSGVFAAGDVQDRKWRQAITAAGSGCMAALEVESYLQALHLDDTAAGHHSDRLDAAWAQQLRQQLQQAQAA